MTVSSVVVRAVAGWTGAETEFPTGIQVLAKSQLVVSLVPDEGARLPLTLGLHYTVGLSPAGVATVVPLPAFPAVPGEVSFVRRTPMTQDYDPTATDTYDAAGHAAALDRSAMRVAELSQAVDDIAAASVVISGGAASVPEGAVYVSDGAGRAVAGPTAAQIEAARVEAVGAAGMATGAAGAAMGAATTANQAAERAEAAATSVEGYVSFEDEQDLSPDQRARALENLGLENIQNALSVLTFSATAGQVAFQLGTTVSPGACLVFHNGAKLSGAGVDYTLTTTTLTLVAAASADDIVAVIAIGAFEVANALTSAANLSDIASAPAARANLGITPQTLAAWAGAVKGHIFGLTLSYVGPTTFSIASGEAGSQRGVRISMALDASLTKSLSAWAAGTGAGSLDTGAIAANTWYHVHLIANSDGTSVDAVLSLEPVAPARPAGYVASRRIGSIRTNGSAQIVQFVQIDDDFFWTAPVADISVNPIPTVATLYTLSVPSGVRVTSHLTAQQVASSTNYIGALLSSPDLPDIAPGAASNPPTGPFNVGTALNYSGSMGSLRLRTDTSSRIRVRANATNANGLFVYTYGWTDNRGKLQ